MAKELKKLYRNLAKTYRSTMGSTANSFKFQFPKKLDTTTHNSSSQKESEVLIPYNVVTFIFVFGLVKGKQAF